MEPDYVEAHFIPLALDTYFRGNSHELEFCEKAGAGGNHLVAVTAGGHRLGDGEGHRGHLLLRERDLAPVLAEFRRLPEERRQPKLLDPESALPPKRPVPQPPENGLIIRGYCTYLSAADGGLPERTRQFYYKENPDAWAAETQSDMLWLTEAEWRSLLPEKKSPGESFEAPQEIRRRLFSTLGIDYMEGSVNALPVRDSRLTLTVAEKPSPQGEVILRMAGSGLMGAPPSPDSQTKERSRGCRVSVSGQLRYDPVSRTITAFDLAGVGQAWGNKMSYTKRAIRIEDHPWHYGIACELVTDRTPYDLIPPYNLLHYGGGMDYFGGESR